MMFLFPYFTFNLPIYHVKVAQSRPTLCNPVDCSLPGSSVHGILQARILEWVAIPFSRGSFQPRDRTQVCSPALWAGSLPSEPPGKPKNPGVDSLSLLQRIFLTQESNWGLLHCRRILYQLSYQRSPSKENLQKKPGKGKLSKNKHKNIQTFLNLVSEV